MPVILNILDKWNGKLTWPLFCQAVADHLNEEKVSRHTLLGYTKIAQEFAHTKKRVSEAQDNEQTENGSDVTLEWALKEIDTLRNKVSRLERDNGLLQQRFIIWQRNYYMMKGVDMVKLDQVELIDKLNTPLPKK
jgi:hypothetical protein